MTQAPDEAVPDQRLLLGLQPRILLLIAVILIILPLLVEFASAFRATVALNDLGSEAAELAAVGAVPAVIEAKIDGVRGSVDGRLVNCALSYAQGDETQDDRGKWRLLGVGAGTNDARPGDRIMVYLTYRHHLIFGGLLGPLFNARDGAVTLETAQYIERR